MTKTIEDAATVFANREYEIGQIDWDALHKGYYHGMKDLFSQPLASRLTAEEKERVRKEYWQAAKDWIEVGDARGYCRTCVALESIFGAEFFKDSPAK